MTQDISVSNDCAKLFLNKRSRHGVIRNYIISFDETQSVLEDVVEKTYDLFHQLCENFKDNHIKARLVAQLIFHRLDNEHNVVGEEDYHFASYASESVYDSKDFYERHMCKIASRLDSFNERGSRMVIHCIKHIHIQLSLCRSA